MQSTMVKVAADGYKINSAEFFKGFSDAANGPGMKVYYEQQNPKNME